MSVHSALTVADASKLLATKVETGRKANRAIVAAAVTYMLANHGDLTFRDFSKEQKGALAGKGDASIYKYIQSAGKVYREYGETLANRVAVMNEIRNASNVFGLVERFMFVEQVHHKATGLMRARFLSVDDIKTELSRPATERTEEQVLTTATNTMLTLIAKHGAKLTGASLQAVIKACVALDVDFAATAIAKVQEEHKAIVAERDAATLANAGLNGAEPVAAPVMSKTVKAAHAAYIDARITEQEFYQKLLVSGMTEAEMVQISSVDNLDDFMAVATTGTMLAA